MNPDDLTQDDPNKVRIRKNVETMQGKGASDAEIETYLRDVEKLAPVTADPMAQTHADFKSGALQRRNKNADDIEGAQVPSALGAAAQALETPLAGVPGGKLAMSVARKLTNGGSLADAQREVNAETEGGGLAGTAARGIGGIASLGIPGLKGLSVAKQGAVLGGADQLFNNDPESSAGGRVVRTGVGALAGLGVGKALEVGSTALRSLAPEWMGGAPTLGNSALRQKGATKAADVVNYGKAEAEGALAPNDPGVTAALAKKDIAPYANEVRNSRTFAGADDATVLREAYKLMSERQGNLSRQMVNAGDFKAGSSLEKSDIGGMKGELLDAADPSMPSLRGAVKAHAQNAGLQDALGTGADAAKRMIAGTAIAGKKLAQNSPEAVIEALKKMSPEEAQAAVRGVLGRVAQKTSPSINPLTGFGMVRPAARVGPLLNAADEQAGNTLPSIGQRSLLALLNSIGTP